METKQTQPVESQNKTNDMKGHSFLEKPFLHVFDDGEVDWILSRLPEIAKILLKLL